MRFSVALALAVAFGVAACSSQSTNEGSGGGGGSAGAGTGGTGGAAGSSGGTAGGGMSGAAGSGGQAGTDGGGATDGSVDADAGPDSYVKCGANAPKCPTDPGRCCFNVDTKTPVCQVESAACLSEDNSRIDCDGSEDCPTGQICCSTVSLLIAIDASIKPPSVGCSTSCKSEYGDLRVQVCDPKQTSPTQCLKGSCKTVIHGGTATSDQVVELNLPVGYGLCK